MNRVQKISELTNQKIWVAPLAGVTDKAYRAICKANGADVLVSEMVSADGLFYAKEKSLEYAQFNEKQRPFGIQIFGNDPKMMAQGAEIILQEKPDFIDINMGCPVKKVVKRGAGSALMKTPKIAMEITKAVKQVLSGTDVPLSVKFRAGWDMDSINCLEYGLMMQEAGADILCLHPRTRSQMFSGKSNWTLIKELKANVEIPVIGNGDIWNAEDAKQMFEQTGCDSIMIGRGVMGNPWIFAKIKYFLETAKILEIDNEQMLQTILQHLELAIKYKGETRALREMRSHLSNYTKGIQGGSRARKIINGSTDLETIVTTLNNLFLMER